MNTENLELNAEENTDKASLNLLNSKSPVTAEDIVKIIEKTIDTQAFEERAIISSNFLAMGVESKHAISIISAINEAFQSDLVLSDLWEHSTPEKLARHINQPIEDAINRDNSLKRTHNSTYNAIYGTIEKHEPIAVIGMACRFANANTPEDFWDNLVNKHCAVEPIRNKRWQAQNKLSQIGILPTFEAQAALLDNITHFDPSFFSISPREAEEMDPQQHLALELSVEALLDAGISVDAQSNRKGAVFLGSAWHDFGELKAKSNLPSALHSATGKSNSLISNRVSYCLGLSGPSLTIDTACSSSLVSIHYARKSLLLNEANWAIAGGINLFCDPEGFVQLGDFGGLSPSGRCHTFSSNADGYVRGEGGGVLILKTLTQAQIDGDKIYALLPGSGVSNDGRSNGLTAPNPEAQAQAIHAALKEAKLEPSAINYIEAHGTGTPLGDPIEIKALNTALGTEARPKEDPLRVGSVKTNIGHLEGAAGIAGLIKLIQSIRHKAIPASLHCDSPNPHIPFQKFNIEVIKESTAWHSNNKKRVGGVTSIGWGGTNCHVIASEYTPPNNENSQTVPTFHEEVLKPYQTIFLCSPQGGQWAGMLKETLGNTPLFQEALQEVDHHLTSEIGWSVSQVLYNQNDWQAVSTDILQPIIFALQVTLANYLATLNIKPNYVVGFCIGEIAAAVISKAISLKEGAYIIGKVSRAQAELSGENRLAVLPTTLNDIQQQSPDFFDKININLKDLDSIEYAGTVATNSHLFGGPKNALEKLVKHFQSQSEVAAFVAIDVATHTSYIESICKKVNEACQTIHLKPSQIPWYSSTLNGYINNQDTESTPKNKALDHLWSNIIRKPYNLPNTIKEFIEDCKKPLIIELNAHPIFKFGILEELEKNRSDYLFHPIIKRGQSLESSMVELHESLHKNALEKHVLKEKPSYLLHSADSPESTSLLILSAHSPEALLALSQQWLSYCDKQINNEQAAVLQDVCNLVALKHTTQAYRMAITAQSWEEVKDTLSAFIKHEYEPNLYRSEIPYFNNTSTAWVFPGQGSQWIGMARDLIKEQPAFRSALLHLGKKLDKHLPLSIISLLESPLLAEHLVKIEVVQPVIFAVQVALSELWLSWGVKPDIIIGHSMGEVAACYIAGFISIDNAINIICQRSQLMSRVACQGAMLVTELAADQAESFCIEYGNKISVAAYNGSKTTVIAGDEEAIKALEITLNEKEIFAKRVNVNIASHTYQVDVLLEPLSKQLGKIKGLKPRFNVYSTVKNRLLEPSDICTQYWLDNLRQPVQFLNAIKYAYDQDIKTFIEISPHPILLASIKQLTDDNNIIEDVTTIASLKRDQPASDCLTQAAAELHSAGGKINWQAFFPTKADARITLKQQYADTHFPLIGWDRQNTWPEALISSASDAQNTLEPSGNTGILKPANQPNLTYLQKNISLKKEAFLSGHQLNQTTLIPGAYWLAYLISALTDEASEKRHIAFNNIKFKEAVSLKKNTHCLMQCVVNSETHEITLFTSQRKESIQNESEKAIKHAWEETLSCEYTYLTESNLKDLNHNLSNKLDHKKLNHHQKSNAFYDEINQYAVSFDQQFKVIQRINWNSEGIEADISFPASAQTMQTQQTLTIDGCLHAMLKIMPVKIESTQKPIFITTDIKQLIWFNSSPQEQPSIDSHTKVHGSIIQGKTNQTVCDIEAKLGDGSQLICRGITYQHGSVHVSATKSLSSGSNSKQENAQDTSDSNLTKSNTNYLIDQLSSAPNDKARMSLLTHCITQHTAAILKIPRKRINPNQPLKSFGLSSLMTLELRQALSKEFDIPVPGTLVFNHPTIHAIGKWLLQEMEQLPTKNDGQENEDKATPVEHSGNTIMQTTKQTGNTVKTETPMQQLIKKLESLEALIES